MSESENGFKVVFAPGCFDDFDGTQEELDDLVAEITALVQSGEVAEMLEEVSVEDLDDLSPELEEFLKIALEADEHDLRQIFEGPRTGKTLH
jgi:hypothetical protein